MSIKIFNTMSGKKEDFVPLVPGSVKMYVCGPTVYDLSHIGHARSAVAFDAVYRHLKYRGFDVAFVGRFVPFSDLPPWFDRLYEQGGFYVAPFAEEEATR